jgi:DNA-directed RNA polymerase specialized sigma24 family protein
VRLLMAPPDISHVENVDAYLFAALRNLHTTRTRRRLLRPEAQLSIVDFDSANFALEALAQTSSLHARDALRTACRFACARRFTSKTASLFIVHFFHGYVRSEIEAIANLRRVSVDTGLTRGRVEIRAYLDDPDAALRAIGLDTIPDLRVEAGRAGEGDDYLIDHGGQVRHDDGRARHDGAAVVDDDAGQRGGRLRVSGDRGDRGGQRAEHRRDTDSGDPEDTDSVNDAKHGTFHLDVDDRTSDRLNVAIE